MARPVTQTRELLDAINPYSNSTIEIYLPDGSVYQLATTDFNLSVPEYEEPFVPGLVRVGEIEENLGAATSGVAVKIANEYKGDMNFWSRLAQADEKLLEDAEVVIKSFKRDGETGWTIYAHDFYFAGKVTKFTVKEAATKDAATKSAVITRYLEFDVVLDTTAVGACLATKTLSPASGFTTPDASDVSDVPSVGAGGTAGSGGAASGGAVDNNGNPFDCFAAGTIISVPGGEASIESVKAGDMVYSFNPETFQIEIDRVTDAIQKTADKYYRLHFSNGARVSVTAHHRFLIGADEWVEAMDLKEGDAVFVRWMDELHLSVLTSKTPITETIEVFNLTVKRNKTYFANGLAVHNTKRSPYDDNFLFNQGGGLFV